MMLRPNPFHKWMRLIFVSLLGLGLMTASGCLPLSVWSEKESASENEATRALPLRKIARTIEIESNFVQIQFDPQQPDQLQSVWQWVDETVIPLSTRQRLLRNGLRVGKVTQPDRVQAKLETLRGEQTRGIVDAFLESAEIASHQMQGAKTIPMRIGKRYELPVRLPIKGTRVVFVDDEPQPVGRTLFDPQFLFAITPDRGRGNQSLTLRMRPEVQYGDMQQDWVQGDAALRIDVRRQSWSLGQLEFELTGGEGDLYLIGETTERQSLGRDMLGGENVDQMEQQTVLLLRFANIPTPADKVAQIRSR
ncbi:MAG: hypothetical protein AAFV88_05640 [Planctomycetota bacterium]